MIPSFNIQPGESSAAVAQRRRIAELLLKQGTDTSPIRHWTQGAARMAQAMMGGYELSRADKIEKEKEAKRDAGFLSAVGISANPVTPPAVPAAPAVAPPAAAPSGVPMASGVQKVAAAMTSPQSAPVKDEYSPDEQSPLDPVPGAITPDRARLLAALQPGESGGRPNVMYGGKTFDSYADHPRQANPIMSGPNAGKTSSAAGTYQFIAPTWDRAKNALGLQDFSPPNQNAAAAYIAGDDYQKRTGQSLDLALAQAGNDPAKIAAIGKALSPTWTSLPGGIEPNQQTNQFVRNMQAPATDFSAVRAGGDGNQAPAPQAAAPAPMQVAQAAPQQASRNTPQIPQAVQDRIRILVQSGNRDLALAEYQKYTSPSQPTYGVIDETADGRKLYGWIDPLKQTTTPHRPSQPGADGTVIGPDGKPVEVPEGQRKPVQEAFAKARAQNALPASWDDTAKLRGEVRQLPSYKNLSEAAPIYKTMLDSAGRNTKASDLNLVYGLGKIFDPGSVVREGEMVMVKNTAGVPDWLVGTINALNGGAALTPETRQAIMREAHSRIQSYQQMFEQDASQYRGVAERNRMNVDDVLPNFGEFTPWAPVGQPGAPDVPIPQARPRMLNQPAPAGAQDINTLLKKYG